MGQELRDGSPSTPSDNPQLATKDNTTTSILTQQAASQGLTVGWEALPYDVQDHILSSMPLLELARVSPTCHAFHACFRMRMAEQDATRIDMAARCFGRNRISCIAGLVASFLRGETMDPNFSKLDPNACRISREGVLQVDGQVLVPCPSRGRPTCEAGEILVSFSYGSLVWPYSRINMLKWSSVSDVMLVWVISPNHSIVVVCVNRLRHKITVDISPCGDSDLEVMAFVQALLTWGSASCWRDVHPSISIHLRGRYLRSGGSTVTSHALVAQILPLLPLLARHRWTMGRWVKGVLLALPWPCHGSSAQRMASSWADAAAERYICAW